MEFLDLQMDEMENVGKTKRMYDFPVATFHKNANFTVSFNRHAKKILNKREYVKIYVNAEYIVFQLSDKKDFNSYKITYNKSGGCYFNCSSLERFVLEGKSFKLYNTKKGVAIKLNEPIQKRK
jgi:hypothetical protein